MSPNVTAVRPNAAITVSTASTIETAVVLLHVWIINTARPTIANVEVIATAAGP